MKHYNVTLEKARLFLKEKDQRLGWSRIVATTRFLLSKNELFRLTYS